MNSRTIYALLVGIDDYPSPLSKLRGCRNDIKAIADFLEDRVARSGDTLRMQTLLDAEATRAAVVKEFRQHLGQARTNDVALFYYSGHGAQADAPPELWHLEPDHLSEGLVLWDSRVEGRWDLADQELAALISELTVGNPHILVVLDCCHSGGGTRAAPDGTTIRLAPTDTRARPIESFIFGQSGFDDLLQPVTPDRAALGGSGWSTARAPHVLLAGCRANETAKETLIGGRSRGAMSAALEACLKTAGDQLTYRELHRQVCASVRGSVREQRPQLETPGPEELDQPFLGGAVATSPGCFVVTREGTGWAMDGGVVHGIASPAGGDCTRVVISDQSGNTVAAADVTRVSAGSSVLRITSGELNPQSSYRAVVVATPLPPLLICMHAASRVAGAEALRVVLSQRGITGPRVIAEVIPDQNPDVEVRANGDGYVLTHPGSTRPITPYAESAEEAVAMLEHIATWTTTLRLVNPSGGLARSAVEIRFDAAPDPGQQLPIEVDGAYRLEYLTDDRSKPREYTITVTNTTDRDLWIALLDLTDTYGIYVDAFPSGSQQLGPGESTPIMLSAVVPETLWLSGVNEVTDVLKLIVSTAEFDPRPLHHGDLNSAATRELQSDVKVKVPSSSLDRLLGRVRTRRAEPQSIADPVAEWFSTDLTVVSVRPSVSANIRSDQSVDLIAGVTVHPHPALRGRIAVTSTADATRDLPAAPVPACLQGEGTAEFSLTSCRDGAPTPDALVLELDSPDTIAGVTSAAPLVISVAQVLQPNEHLVPYAWDGEFYIPLGYARPSPRGDGTEIVLQRLAQPVVTARSVGGSIRMLFRTLAGKVLGVPPAYPVLRLATVAPNGCVQYEGDRAKVTAAVETAQSILIYIHGILGDTERMVGSSVQTTLPNGIGQLYDTVLAFDYENIYTTIEENATALRDQLVAIGLQGHHGKRLDLVAHSMGGLVCRQLIEQVGGVDVHQLISLGSPFWGSPWPNVQKWATEVVALAVNGFLPVAWPVTALAAVLGAVEKVDNALDELQPGSAFLTQLDSAPDPHTLYHVIVGNRSLKPAALDPEPDGRLGRLLQRLNPIRVGDAVVDLVFLNRPNDLAVSVTSARRLPPGRNPEPQVREIPTDHLSFFDDPVSLDVLFEIASAPGTMPPL